jgi:hypothetical protein
MSYWPWKPYFATVNTNWISMTLVSLAHPCRSPAANLFAINQSLHILSPSFSQSSAQSASNTLCRPGLGLSGSPSRSGIPLPSAPSGSTRASEGLLLPSSPCVSLRLAMACSPCAPSIARVGSRDLGHARRAQGLARGARARTSARFQQRLRQRMCAEMRGRRETRRFTCSSSPRMRRSARPHPPSHRPAPCR